MTREEGLVPRLFANIVRAADATPSPADNGHGRLRTRARSLADTVAARAGYSRRYAEPDGAGHRIAALAEHLPGLERTYRMLADERSRSLLVELLTFRALGAGHARLPVDDDSFRAERERIDRELMVEAGTLPVDDPFVPRLDRFRLPARSGVRAIELHSHAAAVASIFALEQYASADTEPAIRAAAGDVVIDAGACWGDTALYFADLVSGSPRGQVYSFEFSPNSLAVLERNLDLNGTLAERIHVVNNALWDRSGDELSFQALGQLTTVEHGGELRVRTVTVDAFVEQAAIDRVDWVKMDIEGAELPALRGAEATLRRDRPTLSIAAYHRPDDLVSIPAWIASLDLGYRLYLGHASPGNDETVLFAHAR
jgi:FkbM family methyltransferase